MREILVHVLLFTSPTFDWWYSPFSQEVLFLGFILSRLILLICARIVAIERSFGSLPTLIIFFLLLILLRFMERFSTLALLIHVLNFYNCLCQSFGFIILNFIFIEKWQSTQKPVYLHLLILDNRHIL
jgi:predicted ferric reductase